MSKLLALDIGTKRTGIAITDDFKLIASGLTTVASKDIIPFLKTYIKNETVERFIIGEPKQMDNTASESEAFILKTINLLSKTFPQIPITRVDERFTSKMAFQTMIDSGLSKKKRRNKALVDEISAVLILQNYLHYN